MARDIRATFQKRKDRLRYRLRQLNRGRVRLTVFRSNKHIYVQLIDDVKGVTLASASTAEKGSKVDAGHTVEAAAKIGSTIAERAKKANVTHVIFDRSGYRYHGRVKALADAARDGGLEF